MAKLTEVRWHGRGGQGAKTASYVLAIAAAEQGWDVQAFPEYGAERRGAPMKSYVRISDAPIRLRCGVKSPSIVIVLDESLIQSENVTEGLGAGAIVIVNTAEDAATVKSKLANKNVTVCACDATQISLDTIGRNMPNTPMLGALAKVSDIVTVEGAQAAVRKQLGKRLRPEVLDANMAAIIRAYEEVKVA